MRKIMMSFLVLAIGLSLSACSGAFWTGAGGGTLAAGAGYEVNAKVQMDNLEKDFAAGKIDKREYDIRKDQIKKMSVFH